MATRCTTLAFPTLWTLLSLQPRPSSLWTTSSTPPLSYSWSPAAQLDSPPLAFAVAASPFIRSGHGRRPHEVYCLPSCCSWPPSSPRMWSSFHWFLTTQCLAANITTRASALAGVLFPAVHRQCQQQRTSVCHPEYLLCSWPSTLTPGSLEQLTSGSLGLFSDPWLLVWCTTSGCGVARVCPPSSPRTSSIPTTRKSERHQTHLTE